MKPEELRLGNYLENDNGDVIQITHDTLPFIVNRHWLKGHYPIPHTEEWLLKFGFERDALPYILKKQLWDRYHFLIYDRSVLQFRIISIAQGAIDTTLYLGALTQPKYVHQLQNLYYELKREELKITSPAPTESKS